MLTAEDARRGLFIFLLFLMAWFDCSTAWTAPDAQGLVKRMEAAYAEVDDYQTHLVITGFGKDKSFRKRTELLYTFKKPNRIRIDFEYPHRGMVVIYPDKGGAVLVRPYKMLGFWTFHLAPDSSLLEISPGQQIDQTDLGLLIRNIAHSVTDMFVGDLKITEDPEHVIIYVLSENPFQKGVTTRYAFFISKRLWLPVAVKESSPSGVLLRKVVYEKLRLNIGVPDSFFRLD